MYQMAFNSSDIYLTRTKGWYSMLSVLLHPRSKGTVRLSSADPRAPLSIDLQFLADEADRVPLRAAIKLSLRLAAQMREQGYALQDALVPASESDADLDAWMHDTGRTTFHYSSTCRMAPEDDPEGGGVVDDQLRVHGVRSLRVADTSILPWILGAHLQASAVAIAEKCADMVIRGV